MDQSPYFTWKSVTENSPPGHGKSILLYRTDGFIYLGHKCRKMRRGIERSGFHLDGYEGGNWVMADKITHWMPLPIPPKQSLSPEVQEHFLDSEQLRDKVIAIVREII